MAQKTVDHSVASTDLSSLILLHSGLSSSPHTDWPPFKFTTFSLCTSNMQFFLSETLFVPPLSTSHCHPKLHPLTLQVSCNVTSYRKPSVIHPDKGRESSSQVLLFHLVIHPSLPEAFITRAITCPMTVSCSRM